MLERLRSNYLDVFSYICTESSHSDIFDNQRQEIGKSRAMGFCVSEKQVGEDISIRRDNAMLVDYKLGYIYLGYSIYNACERIRDGVRVDNHCSYMLDYA